MPRKRPPFAALLADLKTVCGKLNVDWYVFGAQAALLYGSARLTADVDVTIRLGKISTPRLIAVLRRAGFVPRSDDVAFIQTTRVVPVLHLGSGIPADIVLAGPGLEDQFIERARVHDLGGVRVPVASAEDLIAMKILAGRNKDQDDVVAVLTAQHRKLDLVTVRTTLTQLQSALAQDDLVPAFERLLARVRRRSRKPPARGPGRRLDRR